MNTFLNSTRTRNSRARGPRATIAEAGRLAEQALRMKADDRGDPLLRRHVGRLFAGSPPRAATC